MAKQVGTIKIKGTVGGTCFYQLDKDYYAPQKSSLSGKRVKTSAAFRETMRFAGLFARASVIGSAIYRQLPANERNRTIYQGLTAKAMKMLKDGLTEEQVMPELQRVICNSHLW